VFPPGRLLKKVPEEWKELVRMEVGFIGIQRGVMRQFKPVEPVVSSGAYLQRLACQIKRLLLLLVVLVCTDPLFALGADMLKVGIFPRRSAEITQQMFQPMMEYLQQELATEVVLEVPPDFQAFWEQLSQGRYDLVHLNQYQYLLAHHKFGYRAILMNEELGRSEIASVIWVRNDSGIETPTDLKGKKIIFGGGKQAMVSYIMALDLLRSNGLDDSDYLMQFAMNPVNAIQSLYYRQGMAAGAGDVLPRLPALKKIIDSNEIRPLLKGQAVAQLPWAVSAKLSAAEVLRIQQVLVKLKDSPRGRKLLSKAGISGLVPATDRDYDPHREIIARVLGEHF
jgi:phosphonate transport system substrate-binding protein